MEKPLSRLQAVLQDPRSPIIAAAVMVLLGLARTLRFAVNNYSEVRGWEADDISRALLDGHGFSFPGSSRWLWEMWNGNPDTYWPTAWADPVYTVILAAAHGLFGTHAYTFVYVVVLACLLVALACTYRVAEHLRGPWAGALAAGALALNGQVGYAFFGDITNSAFSAFAIALLALLCVRYFEAPSRRRLVVMALMTGGTVLTCPAVQPLLILLPLAVAWLHRADGWRAAGKAAAVFALAAVIIAPWTVRNYVVFDQFVLVRNGAGQASWDGTVGTAMSFMPGITQSPLAPPWQSTGPREALRKFNDKTLRVPVHHYQVDSVIAAPPPGYADMNEAQRDGMYMDRAMGFVREHPGVALQLAIGKAEIYAIKLGRPGLVTIVLSVFAVLLLFRDPRIWPLILLAISYSSPFLLAVPTYARYRAPIEPVFAMLAGIALLELARRLFGVRFARGRNDLLAQRL